jgi:hypothetical protein
MTPSQRDKVLKQVLVNQFSIMTALSAIHMLVLKPIPSHHDAMAGQNLDASLRATIAIIQDIDSGGLVLPGRPAN